MLERAAWTLTNYIVDRQIVVAEDSEVYAFGFECIIADIIQIAVLALVALIFRKPIETALYATGFSLVKQRIGGWHANSHFSCIATFTASTVLTFLGARYLSGWPVFVLTAVAVLLIVKLAPVIHYNNPKTPEQIVVARKQSLLATAIAVPVILLLYVFPITRALSFYGAHGYFIAAITLLIPIRGEEEQ